MINKKNTIYVFLLVFFSAILVWFFYGYEKIDDFDRESLKSERQKNELIQLSEKIREAKRLGEEEKVKKLEKKGERNLPEPYKRLLEVARKKVSDIDFYGKVIDQYNQPIVGAEINYVSSGQHNLTKITRGKIKTDEIGVFNIKVSAYRLALDMPVHPMLADKYMPGTAKKYFLSGSSILLEPRAIGRSIQSWKGYSQNNPYIIRTWKAEKFENVLHGNTLLGLSPDNKVHTFIKTKQYSKMIAKAGVHSDGDLLISCTRDPVGLEKKNGQWEVTIKAIDGGIQEATANYQVEAPSDGYLESVTISQDSGKAYGTSVIKNKHYYYKSHNGMVYGSMKIKFEPYLKKRYCGLYVDYVINKNSSRNLAVKK